MHHSIFNEFVPAAAKACSLHGDWLFPTLGLYPGEPSLKYVKASDTFRMDRLLQAVAYKG